MKTRHIVVAAAFLIALSIGGFAWYRLILHPKPVACGYCLRPLHANLTVTAEIDGEKTQACCARCAISEANQQHKRLRLIEVRDYPTGRGISPSGAWYVEGSHVMACDHDAMRMNEMKETQELAFDRCSPGTFAFAEKQTADEFVTRNGGSVLSFEQLMREVHFQ